MNLQDGLPERVADVLEIRVLFEMLFGGDVGDHEIPTVEQSVALKAGVDEGHADLGQCIAAMFYRLVFCHRELRKGLRAHKNNQPPNRTQDTLPRSLYTTDSPT